MKVTEPVAVLGVTVAVKVTESPEFDGFFEEPTVVEVDALFTVKVPVAVLVDPPPVPDTVKLVAPAGVAAVVEIVNVEVAEAVFSGIVMGFGENEAVAPVGSVVVMLRVTSNALLPPSRATVTTYVALPAVP